MKLESISRMTRSGRRFMDSFSAFFVGLAAGVVIGIIISAVMTAISNHIEKGVSDNE